MGLGSGFGLGLGIGLGLGSGSGSGLRLPNPNPNPDPDLRRVEAQAAHAEGRREAAEQLREVHRRDEVGAARVEGEPLALELRRGVGGDG